MVLGWLVGDGYINTRREGAVTLSFFGKEQAIAPHFAEAVNRLVAAPEGQRQYLVGVQKIGGREESRVESTRLMRLIDPELLENKLQVPTFGTAWFARNAERLPLLHSSQPMASVQGTMEKGISVRLTSVSQDLLEDVQRLAAEFRHCVEYLQKSS